MDDAQPLTSPLCSPKTIPNTMFRGRSGNGLVSSPAFPRLLSISASPAATTARIPTPIYGHFSSQLPRSAAASQIHSPNTAATVTSPLAGVARLSSEPHNALLQRRRRLPLPISESAGLEALQARGIDTILESPRGADSSLSPSTTISMLEELNMKTGSPACANPARVHTPSMLATPLTPHTPTMGLGSADACASASRDGSSHSPSGRRRSDAVSGGESRRFVFSMGFRADCDKCKERVPGHYSHVLRV